MNWIRAKDCNGLVEMEKGKLKRELISEFVKDLEAIRICNIFIDKDKWIERVLEKIEKWEEKEKLK